MSQQDNNQMQQHFYRASAADFGKIKGSPIAYWVSDQFRASFDVSKLGSISVSKQGLATGENERFLRYWHEASFSAIIWGNSNIEESESMLGKWVPYSKGGSYRKWYGNGDYIVKWIDGGEDIRHFKDEKGNEKSRFRAANYYFLPAITWSLTSSNAFGCRYRPEGYVFDINGMSLFPNFIDDAPKILALLNSKVTDYALGILNPTMAFQIGDISSIPAVFPRDKFLADNDCISKFDPVVFARNDWDSYEISWDFRRLPLLSLSKLMPELGAAYQKMLSHWLKTTLEMQRLEQENNRIFIEAYGLQDELTPEVPLSEITLTCNPHYRYGGKLTDEEREARLQSDTICELISYAIGCMMGRYSLDREGLVYAHAGNEGFKALEEEGSYASFAADDDGILPLTSENWFADDVAARIEAFVATVWGKELLEENLNFIADSLTLYAVKPAKKGGETARETLRRYLSTQFYKDHLKTYKKRPIYWLFSSGKEKAFECLVYLHRYSESTLPRMRTEYVTPLLGQMASRIERKRMEQTEASTAEAKRIAKEIDSLTKQLSELRAFDDQLKHHADMRITLDLDDGVKVNYGKFGTLLSDVKAITGDKGE